MEFKTITVKETIKVVTLFDWKDVTAIGLLVALVTGLVVGLICYETGKKTVCDKLGLVQVETLTYNTGVWGWGPDKTISYVPKK